MFEDALESDAFILYEHPSVVTKLRCTVQIWFIQIQFIDDPDKQGCWTSLGSPSIQRLVCFPSVPLFDFDWPCFHFLQSSLTHRFSYESWLSSRGLMLSPFHVRWQTTMFNRLFAYCARINPRALYLWWGLVASTGTKLQKLLLFSTPSSNIDVLLVVTALM